MKKWVVATLALLLPLAAFVYFAPALFDKSTKIEDWQPSAAPAARDDFVSSKQEQAQRRCLGANELGNAYFGDLHIHTAYSMDARSRDMLGTPADAYRFAQGFETGLGPFDSSGNPKRSRKLQRPLDFAAVTDHAEWIGEINICTEIGSPSYNTSDCRAYRGEEGAEFTGYNGLLGKFVNNRLFGLKGFGGRKATICGSDGMLCRNSLKSAWKTSQAATEAANDGSEECSFTAFHGWEFSDGPGMSKVHRNVIFRNELVPEIPISAFEFPGPKALWKKLDELCHQTETGCDAITIPHNSNVSNGRMFTVDYKAEELDEQRRIVAQRARYEPVVEMMQIKGESECKANMWGVLGEDEQCNFEKIRGVDALAPNDCENEIGSGAIGGFGCQSRLDFARYALIEGMVEEKRLGTNPFQFGLIGGTDNHNAAPGDVSEQSYEGCCANTDVEPKQRLSTARGFAGKGAVARNPGGLMGVWASQNTRDDLFDAMQRREVFATSGPRIKPRFYVGWDIDEQICDGNVAEQLSKKSKAVKPMGSELTATERESPLFVASALADIGTEKEPGVGLQRLQVIKIWYDDDGAYHQQVNDMVGDENNGAMLDLGNCRISHPPSQPAVGSMCGTWRDPNYSPKQAAAYYVRVLENPSCRWSWRHCLAEKAAGEQASESCSDSSVPKIIQERAWTSPIWLKTS